MELPDWGQAVIKFSGRQEAEQTAMSSLRPRLARAQADGVIVRWFFVRKSPYWRLRYQPFNDYARHCIDQIMNALATDGEITSWTPGIYEPETLAFGGPIAMETAHELFCADSRYILDHLARSAAASMDRPSLGQRELGVLLGSVLMRGAGQDWYEQGDIWARVASHRRSDARPLPAARLASLKTAVRRLMTVDASPGSQFLADGPLAFMGSWSEAFDCAGQQLARVARRGSLERGLRAVLAHHVIFHWNRLGLPYSGQSILSALARDTVMAEPGSDPIPSRRPPDSAACTQGLA
jgi:protein-L-isoaspartate(D-aspartate) O-methyltransferase